MDGEISDGRTFCGTEDDLEAGAFGSEAIEQGVLVAAADDKKALQLFAGDVGDCGENFRVTRGKAVKDEIGDGGNVASVGSEQGLAETLQLHVEFADGVTGKHELRIVDIDKGARRGTRFAGGEQVG